MAEEIFNVNSQRILAVLSASEKPVNSDRVQQDASISRSTFFREVSRLVGLQLVEKKELRAMIGNRLIRRVAYKLTPKGKSIAEKLQQVSNDISTGKLTLREEIMHCIVVALNSFGEHFGDSIYLSYERSTKKSRESIPDNIDEFMISTTSLFGSHGANSIERTIVKNLIASFPTELRSRENEPLSNVIAFLKKSSIVENGKNKS